MSADQSTGEAVADSGKADGDAAPNSNAGASDRSAAQIRADIELQQRELSSSMEALRSRVNELTDWRRQVREHRKELIAAAAIAGFVVGGIASVMRRRSGRGN